MSSAHGAPITSGSPDARDAASTRDTASASGLAGHVRAKAALCLALIAGAYLALEVVYVLRLPLAMDEFQGAFAVDRLSYQLPYRDYLPYKSVLGYYLQWPALQLGVDLWTRMLAVKLATAVVVAASSFAAGRRLCRHFDPAAVVAGLGLLVVTSTFLERSADLRVDMLTALCGWFSLLALLDGRVARAGLLAGISFLVSQKGVYFALSGGLALLLNAALASSSSSPSAPRAEGVKALRYGLLAAVPMGLYFALFALTASVSTVEQTLLGSARQIAVDDQLSIRHFWLQTISRNPGIYAAMGGGLLLLFSRLRRATARDRLLFGYGAALLSLCLWHKQPWPYFFVILLPTASVLALPLLEAALADDPHAGASGGRKGRRHVAIAAYLLFGILWPLWRVPGVLSRDNGFQREMIELAEGLLGPGDRYLAGLDFVYSHRQVRGLDWLDTPRLASLSQASDAELATVLEDIAEARPKLLLWNYRIAMLPVELRRALIATYAPLAGNVLVYGPLLPTGGAALDVWFDGRYAITGPTDPTETVQIGGRRYAPGDQLELGAGRHRIDAPPGHRLLWIPPRVEQQLAGLEPDHAVPQPLFVDVYSY